MLARAHFSHKELHGKNQKAMITMLEERGVYWNTLADNWKNGTFVFKYFGGITTENFKITEKIRNFIDGIVKTEA
jgi:hypothetical protein